MRKINNFKLKSNRTGFTLLEMIVSLGIFSVVAVIAVGSLVRITGLNRQAHSLQLAMNNVGYVLESISRELRFATTIRCMKGTSDIFTNDNLSSLNSDCSGSTSGGVIVFRSTRSGGTCQLIHAYWFKKNSQNDFIIKKSQQNACGDQVKIGTAVEIVDSNNVKLTDVDLSLDVGVRDYSWVNVGLKGYSGNKENERNSFNVETGISQRISE